MILVFVFFFFFPFLIFFFFSFLLVKRAMSQLVRSSDMNLEVRGGGIWEGAQWWLTQSCCSLRACSVPAPNFSLIAIPWVEEVGA